MNCTKLIKVKPGLMVYTCDPRTQEAEAENLSTLGSPVYRRRPLGGFSRQESK